MTETVRSTLERLERDLVQRIEVVHKQLAPLEKELADVRKAKAALKVDDAWAAAPAASDHFERLSKAVLVPASPYSNLTMNELAKKALKEQFQNGATSAQLLEFFHSVWARTDITRESLSPQLSRLKADGDIDRDRYVWFLLEPKKNEAPTTDQVESASKDGGLGNPLVRPLRSSG